MEVLRNDDFRGVDADNWNPAPAQRGQRVFRINDGDIRADAIEESGKLRAFGFGDRKKMLERLKSGPPAYAAIGA